MRLNTGFKTKKRKGRGDVELRTNKAKLIYTLIAFFTYFLTFLM